MNRIQTACVTCARTGRSFAGRYRDFLLDSGTLVTFATLLLLAAAIQHPGGLVGSGSPADAGSFLYSAAAVVAALLLLGGMLEEFVVARAGKALDALEQLLPDRVTVRRDGRDMLVPLDEVIVGDLLLIRPGERVAVDGEVVTGTAAVNQAAITGESLPVEKGPGGEVFAGTLVEGEHWRCGPPRLAARRHSARFGA